MIENAAGRRFAAVACRVVLQHPLYESPIYLIESISNCRAQFVAEPGSALHATVFKCCIELRLPRRNAFV